MNEQLDIPTTASFMGWKLNRASMLEAIEDLNIELPVIIRFRVFPVNRGFTTFGTHKCIVPGRHIIWINTRIHSKEANYSLWHELTHAMQAEQFDPPWEFNEAYKKAAPEGTKDLSYVNNKFEVEAREYEGHWLLRTEDVWL